MSLISPRLPSKLTLPADLSFPSAMASFSPIHCSLFSSCILFHILYQYATLTLLKCYSFHHASIHIPAPKPTQTQLGVPQHRSSVSSSGPCLLAGCSVPRVSTLHVAFSASQVCNSGPCCQSSYSTISPLCEPVPHAGSVLPGF